MEEIIPKLRDSGITDGELFRDKARAQSPCGVEFVAQSGRGGAWLEWHRAQISTGIGLDGTGHPESFIQQDNDGGLDRRGWACRARRDREFGVLGGDPLISSGRDGVHRVSWEDGDALRRSGGVSQTPFVDLPLNRSRSGTAMGVTEPRDGCHKFGMVSPSEKLKGLEQQEGHQELSPNF